MRRRRSCLTVREALSPFSLVGPRRHFTSSRLLRPLGHRPGATRWWLPTHRIRGIQPQEPQRSVWCVRSLAILLRPRRQRRADLHQTDPFAAPSNPSGNRKHRRPPKRPKVTIAKMILPSPREVSAHRAKVLVRFYPNGPVRRIEFRIDDRDYRPCRSPWRFRVGKGTYAIRVRAVGTAGLRGPVAVKRFWVGKRCTAKYCLGGSGELPPKRRS